MKVEGLDFARNIWTTSKDFVEFENDPIIKQLFEEREELLRQIRNIDGVLGEYEPLNQRYRNVKARFVRSDSSYRTNINCRNKSILFQRFQ